MSLAILATEDNWQGFDDAWNQLVNANGPIEELLAALDIVGAKRRIARCLPLVRQHAESLGGAGRAADAALLLGTTLRAGGPVNDCDRIVHGLFALAALFLGGVSLHPFRLVCNVKRRLPCPATV